MKKLKVAITGLIAILSSAAYAEIPDHNKLTLEVREVVPTAQELYTEVFASSPQPELQLQAIDWNQVVLIGEKVIEIVKKGKPVVDIKRDSVAVVPQGIQAWEQLSGWRAPATKVYSVTAKNYLNLTVIDMRLKVSAMHGGSLDGKGKYLANVVVVPTSVYVMWGFDCDVWAEHRVPVNMGSKGNPVAALGFDIRYRYGNAVNMQEGAQDYLVSGDGQIKEIQ